MTSHSPCGVFLDAIQDIQRATRCVQVCGAVASAMLWDLTVNNFTFQGFPEVQVNYTGEAFEVTLRVGEDVVGPFSLDEKTGTDQAKRIDAGGQVSREFLKTVQGWLFELELAVDKV